MSIKTQHIKSVIRKDNIKPDEADLWFLPTGDARAFHCFNCGRFQFYHQHRVIAFVQDDMSQTLKTPRISPQCPKCGTIFNISVL